MSDNYQAVYDAVRRRIGGVNLNDAFADALRQAFGMSDHHMSCVAQDYSLAAQEQQRPCVVFKPTLRRDGDTWCALLGDNLQDGVYGFGASPHLAMTDFDKSWYAKMEVRPVAPDTPSRHIHENAAQLLIDYFLCEKLGVENAPSVTLEKQGESETESHTWAFWILHDDTTSYLHEDGRIEWCGTAWEAEAAPGAEEARP